MDLHDQRMQCLKMAFELGGKPEAVLSAAQQLLEFVAGPAIPAATEMTDEQRPIVEQSEDVAPDPIAACGTALVMQDNGELADAVVEPLEVSESPADAAVENPAVPETVEQAAETAADRTPEALAAEESEETPQTDASPPASEAESEETASIN